MFRSAYLSPKMGSLLRQHSAALTLFILLLFLAACAKDNPPNNNVQAEFDPVFEINADETLPEPPQNFVTDISYDPEAAVYYDLIDKNINITEEEKAYLTQNGFVISDRLSWERFVEAYAWIYKQDLPVVITTDSILHAVHQSYSNLLQELEREELHPELINFLTATLAHVRLEQAQVSDPELAILYRDVYDYLAVALILARGEALYVHGPGADEGPFIEAYNMHAWEEPEVTLELSQIAHYQSPQISDLVASATLAGTATDLNAGDGGELTLFNTPRSIDYTLFQPRAHYTNSQLLSNYFRAVTWLGQADFRFVSYDPNSSQPQLSKESLIAAKILQEAIDQAGQRPRLQQIEALLSFTAGESDNTTLNDFDQLTADMGWVTSADISATPDETILEQLLTHDYGQQRITGQLIGRHVQNSSGEPVPRPLSFMLLGQRFSIDTWVMGNVVYDRLFDEGEPVKRPLPTGFDVMVALGNDRAITHLEPEFAKYPYAPTLATMRQKIDQFDDSYWQAPLYNQWLGMIRALNQETTAEIYPLAMRNAAWADKALHTQLSSWAQLRHDNILYIKQSYSNVQLECEFPSIYVEPYPEFYAALFDFAQSGQAMVEKALPIYDSLGTQLNTYFQNVSETAVLLTVISEKELAGIDLTIEEQDFLASIVKKQAFGAGCVGPTFEEMWDGWYMHMIYGKDESPALIADVHTNPTNDPSSALYPPRVLHVATGPTAALLMIVDTADGPTLHIGPAFSYYEFAEPGFPPVRLTDEIWRERLTRYGDYPEAPAWVASFRLPLNNPPLSFALPTHDGTLE